MTKRHPVHELYRSGELWNCHIISGLGRKSELLLSKNPPSKGIADLSCTVKKNKILYICVPPGNKQLS